MESAEASLKSTEASVELIKAQIAKTEVRAPFAGRLGFVNVSVGAWLTTGTSIATLSDVEYLKAKFALPQRYASSLNVGDAVDVKDEERNISKSGVVKALEASLSESSRTRRVMVDIRHAGWQSVRGVPLSHMSQCHRHAISHHNLSGIRRSGHPSRRGYQTGYLCVSYT